MYTTSRTLRECSQIGENHSHPPLKFVRVPQRGLVDPNVLHQSITVQMRLVAGPVMMLQNVARIEMVRPPRGRVQRGQRVMIVHRQRAPGRDETLHRVALRRDAGRPHRVQIIEIGENIGGIVLATVVAPVPRLQLGEKVSVSHRVRREILESPPKLDPLVEQQLVPALPPRWDDRLVDVDGHHEFGSMKIVVEAMIVRYQLHAPLDPDILGEEPPPRDPLVRQVTGKREIEPSDHVRPLVQPQHPQHVLVNVEHVEVEEFGAKYAVELDESDDFPRDILVEVQTLDAQGELTASRLSFAPAVLVLYR